MKLMEGCPHVLDLLTASLTPLIALIALYIAYQQWQTNRRRLEINFYDRRLKIYQAVAKYISTVLTGLHPTLEVLFEFRQSTAEADFLFGPDIRDYLDDLFKHGVELRKWAEQYRDGSQHRPEGYDHSEVTKGLADESAWFVAQPEAALQQFKEHMNFLPKTWRVCEFRRK